MLIDVGIACVWLAISVAGALAICTLAGGAVPGDPISEQEPADQGEDSHEERYPVEGDCPRLGLVA
jgi:hypothetical protein